MQNKTRYKPRQWPSSHVLVRMRVQVQVQVPAQVSSQYITPQAKTTHVCLHACSIPRIYYQVCKYARVHMTRVHVISAAQKKKKQKEKEKGKQNLISFCEWDGCGVGWFDWAGLEWAGIGRAVKGCEGCEGCLCFVSRGMDGSIQGLGFFICTCECVRYLYRYVDESVCVCISMCICIYDVIFTSEVGLGWATLGYMGKLGKMRRKGLNQWICIRLYMFTLHAMGCGVGSS
jgi:hypothetical protein